MSVRVGAVVVYVTLYVRTWYGIVCKNFNNVLLSILSLAHSTVYPLYALPSVLGIFLVSVLIRNKRTADCHNKQADSLSYLWFC